MSQAPKKTSSRASPAPDGIGRLSDPNGAGSLALIAVNQTVFQSNMGSLNKAAGGSFSINLRNAAWLSGTDFATCTFSLLSISGNSATSKGWSLVGSTFSCTLANPGSIGSGILELRATDTLGVYVSMGQYQWSVSVGGVSIFKFNPGHYVECINQKVNIIASSSDGSFAQLDSQLALGPEWKGIMFTLPWGHLESSRGNYSIGQTYLTNLLNRANAAGKKIILIVNDKVFGTTDTGKATGGVYFPTYLNTDSEFLNASDPTVGFGHGIYYFNPNGSGGLAFFARTWQANVMDRFIALLQWIGNNFDGHPALEMVRLSSMSIDQSPAYVAQNGYTNTAYFAQLQRCWTAVRPFFPTTMLNQMCDWPASVATALSFYATARPNKIGGGDYDLRDAAGFTGFTGAGSTTKGEAYGNAAFRGSATQGGAAGSGGVDLRLKLPYICTCEQSTWNTGGASGYGVTNFQEMLDIANIIYKAQYIAWAQTDYAAAATHAGFTPPATIPWSAIIKPGVLANPTLANTAMPTDYA